MKKVLIFCMVAMLSLCVSAQSRKTAVKNTAKTTAVAKCDYCHGKGYLQCPRCKGKVEVFYDNKKHEEGDGFLCDMCSCSEKGIPSCSTAATKMFMNSKDVIGKVKCPYCNTKTRKVYTKVSKAAYETELNKNSSNSASTATNDAAKRNEARFNGNNNDYLNGVQNSQNSFDNLNNMKIGSGVIKKTSKKNKKK